MRYLVSWTSSEMIFRGKMHSLMWMWKCFVEPLPLCYMYEVCCFAGIVIWKLISPHPQIQTTHLNFLNVQMMELSLPAVNRGVSLEQRLAEAEGYYQLLRGQIQVGRYWGWTAEKMWGEREGRNDLSSHACTWILYLTTGKDHYRRCSLFKDEKEGCKCHSGL